MVSTEFLFHSTTFQPLPLGVTPPSQSTIVLPTDNSHIPSTTALVPLDTSSGLPHAALPPPSLPSVPTNQHSMRTRAKNSIYKPIQKLSLTAMSHPAELEPTSVRQALKIPKWRKAMSEEFDALMRNGTWTLVPATDIPNIIECKWIFHRKLKPDGTIDRYKARLVAKGFTQRPGLDFGYRGGGMGKRVAEGEGIRLQKKVKRRG